MLAVAGPYPLTSGQPPLAVADAAVLPPGPRGAVSEGPAPGIGAARPPGGPEPPGSEGPPAPDPARDPRALTGPRPAFEANILDTERRFEARLARLELARSREEMRRGLGADAALPGRRPDGPPPGSIPAASGPDGAGMPAASWSLQEPAPLPAAPAPAETGPSPAPRRRPVPPPE